MDITTHDRFLSKTHPIPLHSCWEWSGGIASHGYGVFNHTLAHRYSYSYYIDEIPEGLHVLHICDNKSCVNPDHLFLGTNYDNIEDKIIKGRQARWENSGVAILTNSNVLEIKEKLKRGETQMSIAECFGVDQSTISNIKTGKTWREL